jgi:hypothetical protein
MRSRGRRTTRSPRTSWLASMTLNWPSRRTRALIGSSGCGRKERATTESQNAPSADAHSRACRRRPGRAPPREPGGQTGWQSDSEHRWKQQRVTGSRWIEDTKIDRPRSWTATSRSRALDAQTEGQIHDISGRCGVFLHTQLRHPRVLAPAHSGVGLVDAPDLGSRPAQGEGPCRA